MPESLPSMDAILTKANRQEGRAHLVLGAILLLGGLAWRLGVEGLTGGGMHVTSYGAIGLGIVLLGRGAFATTGRRPTSRD